MSNRKVSVGNLLYGSVEERNEQAGEFLKSYLNQYIVEYPIELEIYFGKIKETKNGLHGAIYIALKEENDLHRFGGKDAE